MSEKILKNDEYRGQSNFIERTKRLQATTGRGLRRIFSGTDVDLSWIEDQDAFRDYKRELLESINPTNLLSVGNLVIANFKMNANNPCLQSLAHLLLPDFLLALGPPYPGLEKNLYDAIRGRKGGELCKDNVYVLPNVVIEATQGPGDLELVPAAISHRKRYLAQLKQGIFRCESGGRNRCIRRARQDAKSYQKALMLDGVLRVNGEVRHVTSWSK